MAPSLSGGPIIAAVRVLAWIELAAALIVGGVGVYQWAVLSPGKGDALAEERARQGITVEDDPRAEVLRARLRQRAASPWTPREWLNLGIWALSGGVISALLLLLLASMAENIAVIRYEMRQRS